MTRNRKQLIIEGKECFDGVRLLGPTRIVIEGSTISAVEKGKVSAEAHYFLTPAFIDPHSHIGMCRAGEPSSEGESNEKLKQILPTVNPLNSVYFDDPTFSIAVDFGVLYSCIIPGSGNLFGGKACVIKNFARSRNEAFLADAGYKMALGYNPRSTVAWNGSRPNTRMGAYHLLETTFDEVLRKKEQSALAREQALLSLRGEQGSMDAEQFDLAQELINKKYKLSFSRDEEALLDVLSGNAPVKVHVHKEDDVMYLLSLIERFGLKVSVEHAGDVHSKQVFRLLGSHNIPVIYGPLGSFPYKTELKNDHYKNTRLLMESGVTFGLMTDHPVVHVSELRDSLKYFLIQGMSEVDALALVTSKNAALIGVDDKLGTLTVGKTASIVGWNKSPLHLGAFPQRVIAEGKVIRGSRSQSK